jgi:hypothetical protein
VQLDVLADHGDLDRSASSRAFSIMARQSSKFASTSACSCRRRATILSRPGATSMSGTS